MLFAQVKQQFKDSPRCVITLLETLQLRTSRVQFVEVNYHSAKKLVGGRLLEDQYSNNIARLLQAN
jgi:hypothetical protein